MIIDITIGEDMVKAKIPVSGKYEIDASIWLKIKFEHIHIFDGESGRSLLA